MGELYVRIDYFGFRSQSWQGAKINAAVKHTRQDGACLARAMSAGPRALPTTESAYATNPLSVFMHTNRAVRPGAKRLGFELRTGWWAETHDVAALRRRLPKRNFPYHWQVTLHQSFKVSWLLGAAKGAPEPWVLADTDTIFQQCDAAEVRRRFELLGAPLVVGAEKKWWPRRDYARNPYPPTRSGLRYPNSGLLIGTAKVSVRVRVGVGVRVRVRIGG